MHQWNKMRMSNSFWRSSKTKANKCPKEVFLFFFFFSIIKKKNHLQTDGPILPSSSEMWTVYKKHKTACTCVCMCVCVCVLVSWFAVVAALCSSLWWLRPNTQLTTEVTFAGAKHSGCCRSLWYSAILRPRALTSLACDSTWVTSNYLFIAF